MDNIKNTIPRYFKGSKVYLVALEREDISLVTKWINDEEINFYNGARFPVGVVEQTAWFEKTQKDNTKKKLVICRNEGEKVGMATLFNTDFRNQNAEIGVYIGTEFQGKGYAKEALQLLIRFAFQELNMHKIYATIIEFNTNSVKLFESIGFTCECRKKEASFTNGKFNDVLIYTLFRRS